MKMHYYNHIMACAKLAAMMLGCYSWFPGYAVVRCSEYNLSHLVASVFKVVARWSSFKRVKVRVNPNPNLTLKTV